MTSSTGRPSNPPLALTSSRQISSAVPITLLGAAPPPVSARLNPTLMGSPLCADAPDRAKNPVINAATDARSAIPHTFPIVSSSWATSVRRLSWCAPSAFRRLALRPPSRRRGCLEAEPISITPYSRVSKLHSCRTQNTCAITAHAPCRNIANPISLGSPRDLRGSAYSYPSPTPVHGRSLLHDFASISECPRFRRSWRLSGHLCSLMRAGPLRGQTGQHWRPRQTERNTARDSAVEACAFLCRRATPCQRQRAGVSMGTVSPTNRCRVGM